MAKVEAFLGDIPSEDATNLQSVSVSAEKPMSDQMT
jgi:hypothetical protein